MKIYNAMTRVVAAVSTRVFVGEELTTNEEWLQTTIQYTTHLITCAEVLKRIPPWIRPVIYRVIPHFRTLRATTDAATRIVKPIVQARREEMDKPGYKLSNDMLSWMLVERVKKSYHDKDYQYLAQFQLQLAFAAIHTTSMAVTNMLFDLVAHPELIPILREEISEELAENNGSWKGQLLRNLRKVDSFMKESQRHNPVGFST